MCCKAIDNQPLGRCADGSARENVPPEVGRGVRQVDAVHLKGVPYGTGGAHLRGWRLVGQLPGAAVTKQHRGGGLDHRDALSHGLEARSSRLRPEQGWSLGRLKEEPLSLACRWLSCPLSSCRLPSVPPVSKFSLPRSHLRLSTSSDLI